MRNEIWLAISTLIIAINTIPVAASSKDAYLAETDSTVVVRDYIANMEYVNGVLERVNFEGGYIDMTGESPRYMYYVTDHLGNVRTVVDEDGNVCQVNHYYPYGDRFEDTRDIPAEESDNTKLFGGKEYSEDTGLHDFEARYDNTLFGRFTTLDPMAEKYYSVSPYSYCAGNPVNRVDPSGMTDYRLYYDGVIEMIPGTENDAPDILYAYLSNDDFTSITVNDKSLLRSLSASDRGSKISKASSSSREVLDLFYFCSNYSNVEWAVHAVRIKTSTPLFTIGTKFSTDSAGSYSDFVDGKPDFSIHSHPGIAPDNESEIFSLGILRGSKREEIQPLLGYDWDNVSSGKTASLYFVYFPSSRRICQLKKGDGYGFTSKLIR